jgi:hypothetical protein
MRKIVTCSISLIFLLSINAYSEENNGVKLLSHKEWHNVKFPKELINRKNYSDANVSTNSEAYAASGFDNRETLPKGKISYSLKNVKNSNGYYTIDRWICVENKYCARYQDYIIISPSFESDGIGEIYTYISSYNLTPGTYESECVIQITGDATSFNESTNKVTINKG